MTFRDEGAKCVWKLLHHKPRGDHWFLTGCIGRPPLGPLKRYRRDDGTIDPLCPRCQKPIKEVRDGE
jgi:hypothetical protein